jgi:putative membrane protein
MSWTTDALKSIWISSLAAACFLVPSCFVCAGDAPKVSPIDKRFLQQASEVSLFTQQFGQLAEKQSKNEEVKQLAQKIVHDYAQTSQKLDTLAQSLGVSIEPKLGDHAARALDKIATLSGKEFDRAALGEMIKDQQSGVRLLEDESKGGKNPDLQQFAASVLPDLQDDVFQTMLLVSEFKQVARNTAFRQP